MLFDWYLFIICYLFEDLDLLDDPRMLRVGLTQSLEALLRTPFARLALEVGLLVTWLV